jgi:hypothetical protein
MLPGIIHNIFLMLSPYKHCCQYCPLDGEGIWMDTQLGKRKLTKVTRWVVCTYAIDSL